MNTPTDHLAELTKHWLNIETPLSEKDMKKLVGYLRKNSRQRIAGGDSKELKKIQKDSLKFIQDVYRLISCMEDEMKSPSDEAREKRIAESLNALELRTDCFAHFTLGKFFESMAGAKGKTK